MARSRPNHIAFRDGIGARAKELGYRRKSAGVYQRDTADHSMWVRAYFLGSVDFSDRAGVVSNALDRMIAAAGLENMSYTNMAAGDCHVSLSAIYNWRDESEASEEEYRAPLRKWGPVYWFYPWGRHWERKDPYTQCHFADRVWRTLDDPQGCAVASAKEWRRIVEPWLEDMQDPVEFAYSYDRYTQVCVSIRALAWACARMEGYAEKLLRRRLERRVLTVEERAESFASNKAIQRMTPDPDERAKDAKEYGESKRTADLAARARVRQAADYLGMSLAD